MRIFVRQTNRDMITRDEILAVNKQGLIQKGEFGYPYYTPVFKVAFDLGCNGVDLSDAPVVTGFRYGAAPETFVSFNFADQFNEKGLSLAAINGEQEIASSMWFSGRPVFEYTGILSGKGSDGEPLIICFAAENWD